MRIPRKADASWVSEGFLRWGVAKLVKAPDFDSGIRGFESFLPSPVDSPLRGSLAHLPQMGPDRSGRQGDIVDRKRPHARRSIDRDFRQVPVERAEVWRTG